jgi:hypothetical protein
LTNAFYFFETVSNQANSAYYSIHVGAHQFALTTTQPVVGRRLSYMFIQLRLEKIQNNMNKELFLDKYIDIENNQFDKKAKQRLSKELVDELRTSDTSFTFNDIEYILNTLLRKK